MYAVSECADVCLSLVRESCVLRNALLSGALRLVRAHPWARWTSRACSSSAGEEERGNDARIAYPIRDYRLLDPEDIAGLKAAVDAAHYSGLRGGVAEAAVDPRERGESGGKQVCSARKL